MAKHSVPPLSVSDKTSLPGAVSVTPLIRVFEGLCDWRKAKGKVYSLPGLLVLLLTGLLCGMEGPTAVADWAAELPYTVRAAMGLPWHRRVSAMTLCRLCWKIDVDALEAALRTWVREVNTQLAQHGDSRRLAVDGKALRGAAKRGAPAAHLLAAMSHQLKTVWGQVPVDHKTNEIPLFSELLRLLAVEGYLFTMDALLTQRAIAQQIIDSGNDYLMVAKDNQPQLVADIRACFDAAPLPDEVRGHAQTTTKGHGRLEVRTIVTSTALNEYLDWPGVAQVAQISRTVSNMRTRTSTWEQVYVLTSLSPERGSPEQLLAANRGHWGIESLHWVRDVVMGEDACAVHKDRASQVLAALRNAAITVIRQAGFPSVTKAIRRYVAQPMRAVNTIRPTDRL